MKLAIQSLIFLSFILKGELGSLGAFTVSGVFEALGILGGNPRPLFIFIMLELLLSSILNMCFIKLCVIKDIFEKNVEFHDIMSK